MTNNPLNNQTLFWDVNLSELDFDKDSNFIINRIIEEGSYEDNMWMLQSYDRQTIVNVIVNSKKISPRSARFWENILEIKEPIKCLTNSFPVQQNKLWR